MANCKCGNETQAGVWLCAPCGDRFEVRLGEVGGVVAEVEQVIPRLTLTATYGDRTPGVRAQHAPAPVKIDPLSDLLELQRWLLNLGLRVAQQSLTPLPGRKSGDVADYLAGNMRRVKTFSNAYELHTQLDALLRALENAVREREHKVFAGRCAQCDTDLYAVKGQPEARCTTCNETYEVLAWRDFAKGLFGQHIGTPTDLSRKLSTPEYGIEVTADRIRKWATARNGNPPKLSRANPSTNETGQPIPPAYRLNDVLDLYHTTRRVPLEGRTA